MRILLVEDDALLGDGLQAGLAQAGFEVDWVRDGVAALHRGRRAASYAAVVLDLGLPRMLGLRGAAARCAPRGLALPVLILTARDAVEDRVRGLDAGADDYLVKPVDLGELAARLRALVRRAERRGGPDAARRAARARPGGAHASRYHGRGGRAASRASSRCCTSSCSTPAACSRASSSRSGSTAWGEEVESNAVEVHVHHLRRKLAPEVIRTVRGVGYLMPRDACDASRRARCARACSCWRCRPSRSCGSASAVYRATSTRATRPTSSSTATSRSRRRCSSRRRHRDDVDELELEHAPQLHRYARRVAFQVWERGRMLRAALRQRARRPALATRRGLRRRRRSTERRWRVFSTLGPRAQGAGAGRRRSADARDAVARRSRAALLTPLLVALPLLARAAVVGGAPAACGRCARSARRSPRAIPTISRRSPRMRLPREVAPLVDGLNHLLRARRDSLERERRFTADAAHELRTPIAALRTQAQVARASRDGRRRAASALRQVIAGCDRAARLVDQMLTLARLDPRARSRPRSGAATSPTSRARRSRSARSRRSNAISTSASRMRRSGQRAGRGRHCSRSSCATCSTMRCVTAPPGGRVVVAVRDAADGAVRLGWPTRARVSLPTRGRGSASDSSGPWATTVPGSGLGLSIVRRVAELHAAIPAFDDAPGGGLVVRVDLPPPSLPR